MRILSFSILMIFSISAGLCQQTTVHFDKPFYVAGEYIFFTFYNHSLPPDSLAAQIVIVSQEGQVVEDFFVQVLTGTGSGYYKTRFDQPSDRYNILGYVFGAHDGSRHMLFSSQLDVFNSSDPAVDSAKPVVSDATIACTELSAALPGLKSQYQCRESIELRLSDEALPDNIKHVSVAVRSKDHYDMQPSIWSSSLDVPGEKFLYGIPVYGHRDIQGDHDITSKLIFGCDAKSFKFGIAQVNDAGDFFVKMPPYVGQRNIQFVDYLRKHMRITPTERTWPQSVLLTAEKELFIKEHLEEFERRKQIYQFFGTVPQLIEHKEVMLDYNHVEPDYILDVTDIDLRGQMFTVFKEILTPLKFRKKKNDKYISRVIYESAGSKLFYTRGATFIINGHVTHNADFVANLPIQEVKLIKIYSGLNKVRTAFGPMGSGGIVDIEMVDPLYSLPKAIQVASLQRNGFQVPLQLPVRPKVRADIPMIDPLLFWDVNVISPSADLPSFLFRASDEVGTYEISILMIDDQGAHYLSQDRFDVVLKAM